MKVSAIEGLCAGFETVSSMTSGIPVGTAGACALRNACARFFVVWFADAIGVVESTFRHRTTSAGFVVEAWISGNAAEVTWSD